MLKCVYVLVFISFDADPHAMNSMTCLRNPFVSFACFDPIGKHMFENKLRPMRESELVSPVCYAYAMGHSVYNV